MDKNAVIIVAAGRGERLGTALGPKQYRILGSQSILQHTASSFLDHPDIHSVVVVIHRDDQMLYEKYTVPHAKLQAPVFGGKTRQESCKAGIDGLDLSQFHNVLIHDAARPFVSHHTISNVINEISDTICTLPAVAIADTVKRADNKGTVSDTLDRNGLFLAQTPQGFRLSAIADAHEKAAKNSALEFTDDAAVAEWAGLLVRLVEGDADNFKITTQADMERAQKMISNQLPSLDIRTGSGYDVHQLGPGDAITLCGLQIPHDKTLIGHSDADVGLHALTDALLGTIGEGDIGSHFPPSDEKWKGASSDRFLAHAVKLVGDSGGKITNLDVTIVCEAPKIGPHRIKMRERIAEICDIDLQRVSVKATTNERIGFIGREEGIAALATASVAFGGADV